MKVCKQCGEEKPLAEFHPAPTCRQGVRPVCKECVTAARRAERAADPEQRDKERQRDRERYANDPARHAAVKARARAHYAANREAHLQNRHDYYEQNREKWELWRAKRKALQRSVEHRPYTRREIYDRDNGTCRICRNSLPYAPGGFAIDHIVPIALGGPDTPANLQLTCQPCNREKWMNLEGQIHLPV
jgi:5-methylcytosine-specific restriction endonuclease McrA